MASLTTTSITTTTSLPPASNGAGDDDEIEVKCADELQREYWYVFFIICVAVIIGMTMFVRRKFFRKDLFNGRPGILYPINLVDDMDFRAPAVVGMVVLTFELLNLFNQQFVVEFRSDTDKEKFPFLSTLMSIPNVVYIGVKFFPALAALILHKYIWVNLLGVFWVCCLLAIRIAETVPCLKKSAPKVDYPELFEILAYYIPIFALHLLLLTLHLFLLVSNLLRRKSKSDNVLFKFYSKMSMGTPTYIDYTTNLFKRKQDPTTAEPGLLQTFKEMFCYSQVKGFTYSTRILTAICLGLLAIYVLFIEMMSAALTLHKLYQALRPELPELEAELLEMVGITNKSDSFLGNYPFIPVIESLEYIMFLVPILSFVFMLLIFYHMLLVYRRNVMNLYRGDYSWISVKDSAMNYVSNSLMYIGYQIAHAIAGFSVLVVLLLLVAFLLCALVIVPIAHGASTFATKMIEKLWPTIVIALVISFGQRLLVRFAFLLDSDSVRLDNRRSFHVFLYFMVFFHAIVGVFSVIKRAILALVLGLVFMCRLDRSTLPKEWEFLDTGYKSYISMLIVETYHSNPLLRSFVDILVAVRDMSEHEKGSKKVKIRWLKAYTLVRNPILMESRFRPKGQFDSDEKEEEMANNTDAERGDGNFDGGGEDGDDGGPEIVNVDKNGFKMTTINL